MSKGRSLTVLLLAAEAAFVSIEAAGFRDNYELALYTQRFAEALVAGRSQEIYWMFCPEFRAEHSFDRFDSALNEWYGGREIKRASHKVVEIRGPGGYVSTWAVFKGAKDYDYLYQSWVRVGREWQLTWVSKILDASFQYGQSDTEQMQRVAEAALRYVLTPQGLSQFRRGLRLPDTVVLVRQGHPEEGELSVDKVAIAWRTTDELAAGKVPAHAPFFIGFGLVRILGDMALVAVDLQPSQAVPRGKYGKKRGIEVYLEWKKGVWRFHSVGKVW